MNIYRFMSVTGDHLLGSNTSGEHYSDKCYPTMQKTKIKIYVDILKAVIVMFDLMWVVQKVWSPNQKEEYSRIFWLWCNTLPLLIKLEKSELVFLVLYKVLVFCLDRIVQLYPSFWVRLRVFWTILVSSLRELSPHQAGSTEGFIIIIFFPPPLFSDHTPHCLNN